MKSKITEAQARRLRVGDQLIVLRTHRNQHGQWLRAGLHGVVRSTDNDGPYFSYEVQWSTEPHGRVRADGPTTWVWARHEDPIALRRRGR
ncbi:MAG: hypothetical protein KGK07_15160 [Chloroflexota bacterium]|nr:hypothetical protein [Chloroflexota bacterium]